MTAAHARPAHDSQPLRPDRLYLGWQFALLHPDPGPAPRRPTPPGREGINDEWLAAQRREESLLNRPLKIAFGCALFGVLMFLGLWVTGVLEWVFALVGIIACLAVGAITGYATLQGEQALKSRVNEEQRRYERRQSELDNRLRVAQEEHARQYQSWEARRSKFESQEQWYAVSVPEEVDRVDIAGGTLAGWSAAVTMIGAARLNAGGALSVVDLSEGAVATDLLGLARRTGIDPLVWVLPVDLPRLDLGLGLGREALADVLSLVVSVSEEQGSARDLSFDNAILERVLEVLGEDATIAQVTAALRALAQVGDPRVDMRMGLLTARQLERIGTMFGRGATDRVVIERAWALESQLRKLENLGTDPARMPGTRVHVVSTDRRAGVFGNRVLGTYVVTALTHALRQAPPGRPWRHTLFLCGAEKLRGDVLDRLIDACETTRTGLVMMYRAIPSHVKERLGRGNAAVGFMRLGNAEDAKTAAEHIGTEHRFVLSQLTETLGTSMTGTSGDSYSSTVGSNDSVSTSTSTSTTESSSRGRGRTDEGPWLGLGDSTWSRSRDSSTSTGDTEGESITEGISNSTTWGRNTSQAYGSNESQARTMQRSREYLVEQHELQQLPVTSMVITHATREGRRIVMADANPAILTLPTATIREFDEVRRQQSLGAAPAESSAAFPPSPDEARPPEPADPRRTPHSSGEARAAESADPRRTPRASGEARAAESADPRRTPRASGEARAAESADPRRTPRASGDREAARAPRPAAPVDPQAPTEPAPAYRRRPADAPPREGDRRGTSPRESEGRREQPPATDPVTDPATDPADSDTEPRPRGAHRSPAQEAPPNLGPPPERLDWRKDKRRR